MFLNIPRPLRRAPAGPRAEVPEASVGVFAISIPLLIQFRQDPTPFGKLIVIGRANSLALAAWIGLVVAGLGCVAALARTNWWLALIAAFAAIQSWAGIVRARRLREATLAPHYAGVARPGYDRRTPLAHWQAPMPLPLRPIPPAETTVR